MLRRLLLLCKSILFDGCFLSFFFSLSIFFSYLITCCTLPLRLSLLPVRARFEVNNCMKVDCVGRHPGVNLQDSVVLKKHVIISSCATEAANHRIYQKLS